MVLSIRSRQRTSVVVTFLIVISLLSTGCDSDPEPTGSQITTSPPTPPTPPPIPLPTPITLPGDPANCPKEYSQALSVTTTVEAEIPYLQDVVACTSILQDAVWLYNRGDEVWKPTAQSESIPIRYASRTVGGISFIEAVSPEYRQLLLGPGTALVVEASPKAVRWNLDIPLSLAWVAHDWITDQIASYSEAAALAALKRQSNRGGAIAGCTLATYKTAMKVPDLRSASMSQLIVDGIGTAAGGSACYSSWMEANRLDGRSFDWNRVERVRIATTFLEQLDTRLTNAAYLNHAITLLNKFK